MAYKDTTVYGVLILVTDDEGEKLLRFFPTYGSELEKNQRSI